MTVELDRPGIRSSLEAANMLHRTAQAIRDSPTQEKSFTFTEKW